MQLLLMNFVDTDMIMRLFMVDWRFIFKSYVPWLELNGRLFGGFTIAIALSCL